MIGRAGGGSGWWCTCAPTLVLRIPHGRGQAWQPAQERAGAQEQEQEQDWLSGLGDLGPPPPWEQLRVVRDTSALHFCVNE